MPDIFFQGGHEALRDGSLVTGCNLRLKIVMSAFSGETEEDSVNLADLSAIDEFDGIGYAERDLAASVTVAYDATDDVLVIDAADGVFTAAGTCAPGSDDFYGLLGYLWVDGTDANDELIFFKSGLSGNANNGEINHAVHPDGLVRVGISP